MRTPKYLILAFAIAAALSQPANSQNPGVLKSASTEITSEREQDGLSGVVRRVRVETAKVVVKDGKLTEGPRVVREITTYDIRGKRIDTVAHPVEPNRPSGKEQYKYDDKGNIVEMIVRGEDGSILARENYEYEFDELGNWKKMTASIGIYEDGKLSFEPTEVTYRSIAYYYNQAVEKIAAAADSKTAPTVSANTTFTAKMPDPAATRTVVPSDSKTDHATKVVPDGEKNANTAAMINNTPTVKDGVKTIETSAASPDPGPATPAPKKPAVKYVTEEVLRAAALNIPQPEFPLAAELAGHQRKVEVQIVVDEKGEVTSAHATSPETLLNEAAENAARKARFQSAKLSDDPSQVFSVISYDFTPKATPPPAPSTPPAASEKIKESTVASNSSTGNVVGTVAAKPGSPVDLKSEPANLYKQGLSYLSAGRYADAEDVLKQFVYRNPDDAMGYAKLGLTYSLLNKNEEAIGAFKLAIKIRPDMVDVDTYYRMGLAYNAIKKYSDALNAFKQAIYVARARSIETNQSNQGSVNITELRYNLGLAYYNQGRYNEAIKELKAVIVANDKFSEAYFGLAMAYVSLGDKRSAENQVERLKPLNPQLAKRLTETIANRALFIPPGCLVFPCNR